MKIMIIVITILEIGYYKDFSIKNCLFLNSDYHLITVFILNFSSLQLEVENRYIGWINCDIPDGKYIFIRIELKGPDNTLRLRQVKVLGTQDGESLQIGKKVTAIQIQQKNCEAETLKVFRLLTSQVCFIFSYLKSCFNSSHSSP